MYPSDRPATTESAAGKNQSPGAPAQALADPKPEGPRCRCGHDRHHYAVSADAEYSAWGWFCNLFGITAHPRKLTYRCRVCDETFDSSDDPKVLMRHI